MEDDILINKMRPGHEMDIKLFAVKVRGGGGGGGRSRNIITFQKFDFYNVYKENMFTIKIKDIREAAKSLVRIN